MQLPLRFHQIAGPATFSFGVSSEVLETQTTQFREMASKYGSRPTGSDGSDHWHRESIAWQYKISSLNKTRLRFDVFVHILLGILMLIRLAPGITSLFGFNILALRRWDMPHPRPWEYAWLFSLVSAIIGWRSTPQNNSFLLKQFMLGTVIFGLVPIVFGIVDLRSDMAAYFSERKYTYVMFGMPAVVLWGLFLAVCTQLHAFGLYFSVVLLKAWRPRTDKLKMR